MKVILLQSGDYNENKAQVLFERLGLEDEKDEITVLEIEADDVYEPDMIFADKQACAEMAGFVMKSNAQKSGAAADFDCNAPKETAGDSSVGECCKKEQNECLIIIESGTYENMAAVRLATLLGYDCFVNAEKAVIDNNEVKEVYTYAYQTNMLAKQSCCGKAVITMKLVGKGTGEKPHNINHQKLKAELEEISGEYSPKEEISEGLETAKTVIICGNGAGKADDIEKIKQLAKNVGVPVGATRPVAANGLIPSEQLIGISGKSISPELCLVLGASGSQAFLAGISDSKKIISVNSDSSAQIFESSDEAITADSKEFVDKLLQLTIEE